MCHWCGHGSPLWPYCLSAWTSRNCIGLLGLRYDMWHYYLIKFLYPIIAPQNFGFSLLFKEKNGVLILSDWLHTHLCFSHVITSLHMPYNRSRRFGIHNISLNAPCGALSPTSYGEMEILQLIFFLEIWGGVTPAQLRLLYKALRGFICPTFQIFKLSKSSWSDPYHYFRKFPYS